MRIPRSTYRLQFNQGFTFADAAALVPYLHQLGIGDLYASPYLQARPGSVHGYDITDHGRLNAEIGTRQDHARLVALLREHGMGHLLDVVPNHMGIAGVSNPWWWQVLEGGADSPYAAYFDIDWTPRRPEQEGKLLLPVLGDSFGAVLERGELRLAYHDGCFRLHYFEQLFPVAPASTAALLRAALARLDGVLEEEHPQRMELESIATALERLPARRRTDRPSVAERQREKTVTRRRLAALNAGSPPVAGALAAALEAFNGVPGQPASFDALEALLEQQPYRLAFWRVAAEEINYRRFFDINELAGVRVELPQVFADTHRLILEMVRAGEVSGLRIDHPDGLYDPRGYLQALQREAGGERGPLYLVVEKILSGDEALPDDWPVAGTVGYEFLNTLNGVLVDPAGAQALELAYRRFTGMRERPRDLVYSRKLQVLRFALVSELTVLTNILARVAAASRRHRDFTWGALRDGVREVVACFPVYRTYADAARGEMSARDRRYVELAVRLERRRNPSVSGSLFDFLRQVLLLEWPAELTPEVREEQVRFVMKFQQLTGPVMARGVEDTAFYVFNRLLSLNEVGSDPERTGVSVAEFHAFNQARAQRWPGALSASSTHDTKRSEDVRARIDLLSEMPEAWAAALERWAALNRPLLGEEEGEPVPDANDQYLLYQTLLGAWPLQEMDEAGRRVFVERMRQYMDKATREAKEHTSWINPNPDYDRGVRDWVAALLDPARSAAFLDDFAAFQRPLARMGMLNALAQTLLKLAAPGVPDIYQGQELWDFSLVDPDNRRPVDFALRRRLLDELRQGPADPARAAQLLESWRDGRVKLWVTWQALQARARHPDAFVRGGYLPVAAEGTRAGHLLAFLRQGGGSALLAVAPRLVAGLEAASGVQGATGPASWGDTRLRAAELAGRWRNLLTGEELRGGEDGLAAAEVLAHFPVALLERIG
jgi:(1->4)-alpha-D-glucan 1-alpha-D-glucosylmutase